MTNNSSKTKLPEQGFVFWPVGTGDSTTVCVKDGIVMQVDLHHLSEAGEGDDPHTPIVDRLVALLPEDDGKPSLAVFVLTHPDEDHCLGFKDLLKRVKIGEIWFTPRVFREYSKDLSDDAKAFRAEAKRRVKQTIDAKGEADSGDRVRIIGYDDLLKEEEYEGFPSDRLTVPGSSIVELDGEDCSSDFTAFVHAPFKDDSSGERNDTSVALQVTLRSGDAAGRAFLLGDLSYPTIKRIFEKSKAEDLAWDVFLTPHHCSKSVMYWKEEDEEEEKLKQDILDAIEKAASENGYIVASCEPIPASNEPGDNPPHARAKHRYEEIAPVGFLCTQEHPNEKEPEPIVFSLEDGGLDYSEPEGKRAPAKKSLAGAAAVARGSDEPPAKRVGFGREA